MRILGILAFALLVTAGLGTPAQALPVPVEVKFPDGITAKLTFPGSLADLVLLPDADGNIPVQVTIYRQSGGAWQQVGIGASLRVFNALPETDLVSQYFFSSATAPVTVSFPASALNGPGFYDIFITFSSLGGSPVPTSHHNLLKNELIDNNLFNTADFLDYHGATRLLYVAAPGVPELPPLPPLPL